MFLNSSSSFSFGVVFFNRNLVLDWAARFDLEICVVAGAELCYISRYSVYRTFGGRFLRYSSRVFSGSLCHNKGAAIMQDCNFRLKLKNIEKCPLCRASMSPIVEQPRPQKFKSK